MLRHRKTYIFPTRYGLLFILLLLVMLVGSANYNNNLGFLLTFLLSSMCLVSLYDTHGNIRGIRIISADARPTFAGDYAMFELMMRIPGKDRPAVQVYFTDQPDLEPVVLRAGEDNRIRRSKKTVSRGLFHPGAVTIASVYPLGIFRSWTTISLDMHCTVYPRPVFSTSGFQRSPSSFSGDGQPSWPGAEDFRELSTYQPGDSPRHISWKKLAGGQGLFSKRFEGSTGNTTMIDWQALTATDPETRLSIMCGLILKAHQLNLEYGLRLLDVVIAADTGSPHKHRCLKQLAFFQQPDTDKAKP